MSHVFIMGYSVFYFLCRRHAHFVQECSNTRLHNRLTLCMLHRLLLHIQKGCRPEGKVLQDGYAYCDTHKEQHTVAQNMDIRPILACVKNGCPERTFVSTPQ